MVCEFFARGGTRRELSWRSEEGKEDYWCRSSERCAGGDDARIGHARARQEGCLKNLAASDRGEGESTAATAETSWKSSAGRNRDHTPTFRMNNCCRIRRELGAEKQRAAQANIIFF